MTTPKRRGRHEPPRVFLHLGEPKTATTFVQKLIWGSRRELAQSGVQLAGTGEQAVYRAVQDLRGIEKRPDDPAAAWVGEWDVLAKRALRAQQVSIISHELLCAVDDAQAAHAVASLRDAEVHVVLTVRDVASLLPAEWQESIKHRSTRGWDDWLDDVIDREFGSFSGFGPQPDDKRRDYWFWRVHDTARILEIWQRHVPTANIHVVTVPPRGSDRSLVWRRMAGLFGIADDAVDLDVVRGNESLGPAEVELLRRLNMTLSPEVPSWFYMAHVKDPLAHDALAQRPSRGRLELPPDRLPWAQGYADQLSARLAQAGYDIIGDLADLQPARPSGQALHPAEVTDDEVLDAAITANAALLERRYNRLVRVPAHRSPIGDLVIRAVHAAPRTQRRLYALSERNRVLGSLRGRIRDGIERSRS